jgi:hypothetical protein
MNPCILAVAIFLAAPGGEIALPAGTPVSSTDSEHLLFIGDAEYVIEPEDVVCPAAAQWASY